MQIVCCQFDIRWEDREANFERVRALLSSRAIERGALVVLPEMFATGFSMNVATIAEGEERPTERFLSQIAREHDAYALGGMVTLGPDGKGRNECLVCGPDGATVARYQKIHPFTYGTESQSYTGGDQIVTFACNDFTAAPFICYDLRFPEVVRHAMRRGAQLYTVIANWPAARESHWLTVLRARAIENQAYVVGVNRVGQDPGNSYSGRSQIISPQGDILIDGGNDEGLVVADANVSVLTDYRMKFPALRDARMLS